MRVLAHSIRRHSSLPVQVVPLHQAMATQRVPAPMPADPALRARTPFSFQRFAIPELCAFAGRAIYLDSDMLVFSDIAALWQAPMPVPVRAVAARRWRLRRPQLSVMLLDCASLDWCIADLIRRLDRAELTYQAIMDGVVIGTDLAQDLPPVWNDLEHFAADETALLHFTDMARQPWLDGSNRLAPLWCRALIEAVDAGDIAIDEVAAEVAAGRVRPSLLCQVQRRIADPRALARAERLQDLTSFTPPHRRRGNDTAGAAANAPRPLRARALLLANDMGLARARTELGHLLRWITSSAAAAARSAHRGTSG